MALGKTIKWKILLLLFSSMAGSLLFVGLALSYLLEQQHERAVRADFADFFDRARSVMADVEQKLEHGSGLLAARQGLVSSLNLINEYTDIDDYQPLVFDGEKQRLSELLANFGRSAGLQRAALYDAAGWLVAFSDNEAGHVQRGYLSFEGGKPVVRAMSFDGVGEPAAVARDDYWQQMMLRQPGPAGPVRVEEKGKLGISQYRPVTRRLPDGSSKIIGHLWLTRYLDQRMLERIGQGSAVRYAVQRADKLLAGDGPVVDFRQVIKKARSLAQAEGERDHALLLDAEHYIEARRLPMQTGEDALLIATFDRGHVAQQVSQTRNVILWVLLLAALVVLPVGFIFAHYGISRPTRALTRHARMIREGRYDLPEMHFDTRELNTVASALHEAARTIRERETELRRAHHELERRVEARTRDLAQANTRLGEEVLERKQAERQLEASRIMLQKVIDHIPQYVFWKDRYSVYLGCNRNFLQAAGLSDVSELVGKTDYDMPWSREEADLYREMDRRVMDAGQEELHIQETQHTAEGEVIFVDTNKVPLHGADGEVIGILGTYEDITERVRVQKAVVQAKEEAVMANQAKSEFLSRMSHELRTPLNAILGFAQLLELDGEHGLSRQQHDSVVEILQAGRHLLELINEILDLARVESGRLEVRPQAVDIHRMLADCLRLVDTMVQEHRIHVSYQPDDGPGPLVQADPFRLRQVLLNLLSNAIKYNVEGGELALTVSRLEDGRLRVGVRDSGIGISEQDQQRLFQPFLRLGDRSGQVEGTGIGLVIAKELIELMGGEMGFHSMLGAGSEFWFVLQQMDEATPVPRAESSETAGRVGGVVADACLDVLYVEDNAANIRLLERLMAMRPNCRLRVEQTAEAGLAWAREHQPDLILMDIALPGMSGIEAAGLLAEDDRSRHIPVVALTANAMAHDRAEAMAAGFAGYLTKPLDAAAFLALIDRSMPGNRPDAEVTAERGD